MADQYVGEIRLAGFNFAPPGWLSCDGSQQKISDYTSLFTLIGVTYGGDGNTTFNLPDLRGRVPVHRDSAGGTALSLGTQIGSESVALQGQQVGAHNHRVATGPTGVGSTPNNSVLLGDVGGGGSGITPPPAYGPAGTPIAMAGASIGPAGASQPHENRQPLLAVNYIISTEGVMPSQN